MSTKIRKYKIGMYKKGGYKESYPQVINILWISGVYDSGKWGKFGLTKP